MKCNDIEKLLVDYLDNELDAVTRGQVEAHLLTCEKCNAELKGMQAIQEDIANTEMVKPSPALRRNFMDMLHEEAIDLVRQDKDKQTGGKIISIKVSSLVWRAAAACIILAVGILIGTKINTGASIQGPVAINPTKQDTQKKQLIDMLDDESPSQRIEAVNYAENIAPSKQVVDVLLNTLNTDKNANVRVAAVYALEKYSSTRGVLDSLTVSLTKQTEPVVQILLIDLLASKKAVKAAKPMQDIISNSKNIQPVKDAAAKGLKQL